MAPGQFFLSRTTVEIMKMSFYVLFPVGSLLYYSNPKNYEVGIKETLCMDGAPPDPEEIAELEELKIQVRRGKLEKLKQQVAKELEKQKHQSV